MKEHAQAYAGSINVKTAIEEQKFSGFVFNIALLSLIILILDGYDMLAPSYVIPALAKQWHVNPGKFGPILAVGNFGLILGAIVFGYVGDKFGRKASILSSSIFFGIFSFACAFSTGLSSLMVLRFLAAMGVGGLQPAVTVLSSDYAPHKSKMRRVTVLFVGANIGSALAGFTTSRVLPTFGWQSVFIIGGLAPIIFVPILWIWLPESLTWLAANNKKPARIAKVMKKLRPDLTVTPDTRFVYEKEDKKERISLKQLFAGRLAFITPMLWLNFMIAAFTLLFIVGWLPTLFVAKGMPMTDAALIGSLSPFAGIIGSALVGLLFRKSGYKWGAIVPAAAFVCIAPFGLVPFGSLMVAMVALQGICIVANYAIQTALVPIFYPVNNRSNAAGIALAVSKVGQIIAPLLGGIMIAAHVSLQRIFAIVSIPMIASTLILFVLALIYDRHYSSPNAV